MSKRNEINSINTLNNQQAAKPDKSIYLKMSQLQKEEPLKVSKEWIFIVTAPEVKDNEEICISGDIPALGQWDYKKAVAMEQIKNTNKWSVSVVIPSTKDVKYRYALCINNKNSNGVTIQKWETHIHPRLVKEKDLHPNIDEFGKQGDEFSLSTGWLTQHTIIQLQFYNNPLNLKTKLMDRTINIKVTPVKLTFGNEITLEESMSNDIEVGNLHGVTVEASTLAKDPSVCIPKPQEQFGTAYNRDDILLINVKVPEVNTLAYLVDLYTHSSRASPEHPPYHIGYTYILPNMFKSSEGGLELPITCNVKHRPLGTVILQYLIIKPMETDMCNFEVSYSKYWDRSWTGLEVGHRGLGASFKTKEGNSIRENTIASLKKAALSGADLLEFDVQLSKDLIPVIYHDFYVCISMKRKKEIEFSEMLELPVKDLTLQQLQKLKVYHLVEGRNHETIFNDEDLDEHQPFPTLESTLNIIEKHVGFNVELKWTMELKDGSFELNNPFDMNLYVDKVLEVVLKNAGERRIVFSCFNPDICTMVRNKQNKYPVMFLTVGETKKYPPYKDPRCLSIPAAVESAVGSDILGVVVHTEDLLRDPSQVKLVTDAGLVIFCWGDDNNDKNTIRKLKAMGLHAVIYDKLDKYTTKEVRESIFLVEARESEYLQLAALEDGGGASPAERDGDVAEEASTAAEPGRGLHLDLKQRHLLQEHSTATSLVSLASSIQIGDPTLKRTKDIIRATDKEAQLKEPPPPICTGNPKKTPKRSRIDGSL